MLRPSRRLTAAAGFAVILAMAAPALASAQAAAPMRGAAHNGGLSATVHRGTLQAGSSIQAGHAFPSASSTVIGSTGFVDDDEVGYFWSVARGDSVAERFKGPATITRAVFRLDVPTNALASGATVDWTASINGKDVGSFQVVSGQVGGFTERYKFEAIKGRRYAVKIRVTNEVASGDGSITLRYAGTGPHSVALRK